MSRMMNRKRWMGLCLGVVALVAVAMRAPAADEDAGNDKPAATQPKDASKPAKPRDYSGKYLAEGRNNDGRNYKAMVEVTREGEVYTVLWVLGPREAYIGVGLTEGDALCVGWTTAQVPGLVVYKPGADGKLVGRWTAPGAGGKVFKETLTPVK
jgi:hypothetical protein